MSTVLIKPSTGDVTLYLWHNHPKPWKLNHGRISKQYISLDGTICVDFEISKKVAQKSRDWSDSKNGIIIEVLDANGVPVMENWVIFGNKNKIKTTMCVRDSQ